SWTRSSTSACRRGRGPPEAARGRGRAPAPAPRDKPPAAAGGTAPGLVPPHPLPVGTATAGDVTTEKLQGAVPPPVPGRVPCPLTEAVTGRGLESVGARRRAAIGQAAAGGAGRESGRARRMPAAGNAAGGVPAEAVAVAVAPNGIEAAVSGTTVANLCLVICVRSA
ncbi:unnamed protein product, partial [Ectocarpus sp. 12 AP-2014]